jgi:hypothetical protein
MRLPGSALLGLAAMLFLSCMNLPDAAMAQGAADGLRGDFAVTIAPEDIPPVLIGGASLIGRWHISFDEDGTYELGRQDVGSLAVGQFDATDDLLRIHGETGILACADGSDGVEARYEWTVAEDRLLLTAIDEPCDLRRLLFTTRTLSELVACPPLGVSAGSEVRDDGPAGAMPAPSPRATPPPSTPPDGDIDMLLKKMSDCWATRQPERFLQLLSQEHRATQRPEDGDDETRFILTMGAPVVWELAGEVEWDGAGCATATVRQTLGDNIDELRYAFVFEDGVWRWDGIANDS